MFRRPVVYVLIVWFAFIAMHGYYFLLGWWNTPHPSYVPLLLFVGVQVIGAVLALIFGLWRTVRGPKRLESACWILLALLPGFIWYSQVSLTFQIMEERRSRNVEAHWYYQTIQPIAAALFDGVGRWTLPHRLEGDRVVMFYDDRVPDPQRDLEVMDKFIKDEEFYLGAAMPTKIHWMRNNLLGQPGLALAWIAVADYFPPPDHEKKDHTVGSIDYHEAAHNIISVPSTIMAGWGDYPPMLLLEGWAEARSEKWDELVEQCYRYRYMKQSLTILEAASKEYYNQTDHRIYIQGGALVTVLLDKFGPEKFRELYLTCRRSTFENDIRRAYGMTLEELDAFYWKEIDAYRSTQYSFEKATESLSEPEKKLLTEFRAAYDRQTEAFDRWSDALFLEASLEDSYDSTLQKTNGRTELTFRSKDGNLFRLDKTGAGSRTEIDQESGTTTETKYRRIDAQLTTPGDWFHITRMTRTGQDDFENCWHVALKPRDWKVRKLDLKRNSLTAWIPFHLLSATHHHQFSNPDEYLWCPPVGTAFVSMVQDENRTLLTMKTPWNEKDETLILHLDHRNDWRLDRAEMTRKLDDGRMVISTDIREYDEAIDGFHVVKKRTVRYERPNSTEVSVIEILRCENNPTLNTDIFTKESLPLHEKLQMAEGKPGLDSERRLNRHLAVIALWFVLPVAVIIRKRRYLNKSGLPSKIGENSAALFS